MSQLYKGERPVGTNIWKLCTVWLWVTFNELLMIMSTHSKNTPKGPEGGPYPQGKLNLWYSSGSYPIGML